MQIPKKEITEYFLKGTVGKSKTIPQSFTYIPTTRTNRMVHHLTRLELLGLASQKTHFTSYHTTTSKSSFKGRRIPSRGGLNKTGILSLGQDSENF